MTVVPFAAAGIRAIAVGLERILEGQRFVTQSMSNREKPPVLGAGPGR